MLKDTGRLIFTFHHSKRQAWWTIFEAVTSAGFRIVDYFPAQSEYRVNPHIRNKQAIDMDLVLICQKQSQSHRMLSMSPADALERAVRVVGHYENGSRNLVFLHFVGELLRSASSSIQDARPSYEWFESAIELFDALQTPLTAETEPKSLTVQLALFDDKPAYEAE